jgi:Biopolymer transport protein ExbD/TolR
MYQILACSIIALAVFFDRLAFLRHKHLVPERLRGVTRVWQRGEFEVAWGLCQQQDMRLAHILPDGLQKIKDGLQEFCAWHKKSEQDYNISLPSMTDIIFHLLIFFMVATVLKDSTRRFDVPLPDARSGQVAEARGLTIEMTADGRYRSTVTSSPRSNWSNNSNRRGDRRPTVGGNQDR